jgi:hypothetical protein
MLLVSYYLTIKSKAMKANFNPDNYRESNDPGEGGCCGGIGCC